MSIDRESFADVRPKTQAAVQDVAWRYGVGIPDAVAQAIASAVLECADDEYRASCQVVPELWGQPGVQERVTRNLSFQTAIDLMERELLPTALPRQVVTRSEIPWEPLTIEWVTPVRKAPSR